MGGVFGLFCEPALTLDEPSHFCNRSSTCRQDADLNAFGYDNGHLGSKDSTARLAPGFKMAVVLVELWSSIYFHAFRDSQPLVFFGIYTAKILPATFAVCIFELNS